MVTIENKFTGEVFGPFNEDQINDAFQALGFSGELPEDWIEMINKIRDHDDLKLKFSEFNEIAYHGLITDHKLFDSIAGGDGGPDQWITEEAWDNLEKNDNPSSVIGDMTHRCPDSGIFKDYGLSDISNHDQATALVRFFQTLGF